MIVLGSALGGILWFWDRHHVHTFQFGAAVSTVAIDATDTLLAVSGGGGTYGGTFTPAQQAVQVWGLDDKQLRYTILDYPCPSGALAFHPTRAELGWPMTMGRL